MTTWEERARQIVAEVASRSADINQAISLTDEDIVIHVSMEGQKGDE